MAWSFSLSVVLAVCCAIGLLTPEVAAATVTRSIPGVNGAGHLTTFSDENGEYTMFPPRAGSGSSGSSQYFSEDMDFTTFPGLILVGAADNLYLLDMNLQPVENGILNWNASDSSVSTCTRNSIYTKKADYYCRNHIRIYSRFPAMPDLLYVCGTQAISEAQCRAVNVSGGSFVRSYEPYTVSSRVLSVNPDYPSYGRFRNRPGDDSFISWYYYEQSVQYKYAFEVQDVQWNSTSQQLQNSFRFGQIDNWVTEPMYVSDFVDLSYNVNDNDGRNFDYYYSFIRERVRHNFQYTPEAEVGTLSYVLRVCQDDPGVEYTDGTPPSFGTALKARLFCDFEGPNTGENPLAASDMRYNNIWAVTFSGSGVDGEIGSSNTVMYAAFSGPITGPPGAAICTFQAQPSFPLGGTMTNRGVFDTFTRDIIIPRSGNDFEIRNHNFYGCNNVSRPATGVSITSKTIDVSERLDQISGNPLLILDGYYVTGMTADRTCVVSSNNPGQCQQLDVLFVGTSTGRVMKTWVEGNLPKVIAEDMSLESDVYVRSLKIESVNGSKYLYASTRPHLYKLSLARCGRHKNISFCIESRDPYCVWNAISEACELSDLTLSQPVPSHILQNVFRGLIPNIVSVTLSPAEHTVVEGANINVEIVGNGSLPDGLLSVALLQGDTVISGPFNVTGFTLMSGARNVSVGMVVPVPDDQQFNDTRKYRVCLLTDNYAAVMFQRRCTGVTVYDNDALNISLTASDYDAVEGSRINIGISPEEPMPEGVSLELLQGQTVVSKISYTNRPTVSVSVPDDTQFRGVQTYTLQLCSNSPDVVFGIQNATLTVTDNDGFIAQVGLTNLDNVCPKWKNTQTKEKLDALDMAIKVSIGRSFSIDRIEVLCLDLSHPYEAVYRFNVTTNEGDALVIAKDLQSWVATGETIQPYKFTVDPSCNTQVSSVEDDLCKFSRAGGLLQSDSGPSSAVVGLAVVLVVALVAVLLLGVALVTMYYCFNKKLQSVSSQAKSEEHHSNGGNSSSLPVVKTDLSSPVGPAIERFNRPAHLTISTEKDGRVQEEAMNTLGPLPNGQRKASEQMSPTESNSINSAAPLLTNGKDSTESPFNFTKPSSETNL